MNVKNNLKPSERLMRIDLDLFLLHLWQKRVCLAGWGLSLALVSLLISFLFSPLYVSEVHFLPVGTKQLPVFLKSRTAAALVINQLPEVKQWLWVRSPGADKYAIELQKKVVVKSSNREDHPHVFRVELGSARMAADVANAYVAVVAEHVNSPEFDMAQRHSQIIRFQYDKFFAKMRQAEEKLREFQEIHGLIYLDSQTAATVGLVAQIEARIFKKEIELQALQTSPESQLALKRANEISALKDTLDELKGEQEGLLLSTGAVKTSSPGLTGAPQLRLEHQKLRRDVTLAEQACMQLQTQLNSAVIQEEKEGVSFMIIDKAIIADKPSYPSRTLFSVFGMLLGLLTGILRSCYTFANSFKKPE